MRDRQEYWNLLQQVLTMAHGMVNCLPPENNSQGREILRFLNEYAYIGFATGAGSFDVGRFIDRQAFPGKQCDGISIILCFSDDTPPFPIPREANVFKAGVFLRMDQAIILYNVDHWSIPELALTLLHEGRHARHRLGGSLATLPPLDQDDTFHEENTLSFHLYVLSVWAKERWTTVVNHGIRWLASQPLISLNENEILYQEVEEYCSELDVIFGEPLHENARLLRQVLMSIEANTHYWASRCPMLKIEQVFHAIASYVSK